MNEGSIFATRQCALGGTGLVQCSPRRSGNDELIIGRFRNGAGTLDEVFVKINGETHYVWAGGRPRGRGP